MSGCKFHEWLCDWWEKLRKKYICFANRKNWPTKKYSVVCIVRFHDKFIRHGKSRCKLNWELNPIPIIHPCLYSQPSRLNTQKVPRRSPRKRALPEPDEYEVFTETKLKTSHHLQVNTPHSVMTSRVLITEPNITVYVWHREWCSCCTWMYNHWH